MVPDSKTHQIVQKSTNTKKLDQVRLGLQQTIVLTAGLCVISTNRGLKVNWAS